MPNLLHQLHVQSTKSRRFWVMLCCCVAMTLPAGSGGSARAALGHDIFPEPARQTSVKAQEPDGQAPKATKADGPLAGKKVMVTRQGAELRTPEATVWKAYIGEVYDVTLHNGEWLWINSKGGWLWQQETLPFDTVVEDATKMIKANPSFMTYQLRGMALLAHDKPAVAIRDFDMALRMSPDNPGLLTNRGNAYRQMGDNAKAISDYTAALRADPGNFFAWHNRATALIASEKYDDALRDIGRALQLNPEYSEALNNRGVVYLKLRKYDKAGRDFTAALKVDPRNLNALENRADLLRRQGKYAEAMKDFETAIQLTPEQHRFTNDLAWLLATAKDEQFRDGERAVGLAKAACAATDFKDWNTLDTLAAASAEVGDFKQAQSWAATAMELAPDEEKSKIEDRLRSYTDDRPFRE